MKVAVLHDLSRSRLVGEILVVDPGSARREGVLSKLPDRKRVRVLGFDFRDRRRALWALRGTQVLVNCAWYELNLEAMDLALALRSHYVDLGGLYHMTLRQLRKDRAFRKIGRLAVLG